MKIQHSIEIACPKEDVFAFLVSHEHMPLWISTLESSRAEDSAATLEPGSEFAQEHVERGKRVQFAGKVVEHCVPDALTLELSNKDAQVLLKYRLQDLGSSTRLDQTTEVKLHSLMLRMVAGAFEGTARERLLADFEVLKRLLESGVES